MTLEGIINAARIALRDQEGVQETDHLLPRDTVTLYANEAVNEACRRARLITDRSTPEICTIAVTAGVAVYSIDPRIIKIRGASLADRKEQLRRVSVIDLDNDVPGWESHTGATTAFVPDYESGKLALYRIPYANNTLKLRVVRLPLEPLNDLDDVPEFAPGYHAALVQYILWKMYSIEDTELYDPRKAALADKEFEKEFGPKRSARDEVWENSQPLPEYE